ncbi:MAG: SpoIIE family protein phosphatase [Bacteroidia bacterium]|jgi:serine phosphatase RsbU (regulator of sigma subunit)|nr:SpoIIE family protein phosphatase [Bacteroidia bacterium]
MKLSTNHRILLSISILIVFYCITGYISIKNLVESRNKTTKNSQIIQPSIILLSELELMIVTSKNYSSSWLNFDIREHADKKKLIRIHKSSYPQLINKIKVISAVWDDLENKSALKLILAGCDTLLSSQKKIMSSLSTMNAYNDFLLRVAVEGFLDDVDYRTVTTVEQLHALLVRLKLQSEAEEVVILKAFTSIKTTNIVLTILSIIISLVVAFSVYRLLKIEEQKNVLAKEHAISQLQRLLLAEKNKEITDSISYAKRLQQSILPSINAIKKRFSNHFIVYKPKDIVSGDFYWFKEISDKEVLIAAADCTGHGVPGAFVSFVCNSSLNSVISELGITNPGLILDKTSEYVQTAFSQYGELDVKDGMDIALCNFIRSDTGVQLNYSGANNSICVVKKNKLTVLEATRQPIGSGKAKEKFITHSILLDKGDMVYLFTDGFIDQFGGPKSKKYKSKNFYSFLQNISTEKIDHQELLVNKEFADWMGSNFQVDDVMVIGIQID